MDLESGFCCFMMDLTRAVDPHLFCADPDLAGFFSMQIGIQLLSPCGFGFNKICKNYRYLMKSLL